MRDDPGRQNRVTAETAIDRLPGDVIGEMAEAAATDRLRRAHRIEARARRRHAHIADEITHRRRITSVLGIEVAGIGEQRMVAVERRGNIRFDEAQHAVADGDDIVRQIEGDRAQARAACVARNVFMRSRPLRIFSAEFA